MKGLDRRRLALLATGHGCADLCQGAVPALLPFLIAERGLRLAAATALLTAATIGSSIVQPLFGLWADRLSSPVLVPAGLAAGAVGLGATGLCDSYAALAGALFVSGLGVAAFHPEGARMANLASGDERGRGMSYFSVGGNAGFALGPALAAPVAAVLGLGATPLLAIPGLVMAVVTWRALHARPADGAAAAAQPATPVARRAQDAPPPAAWAPFGRLVGAAVSRTVAFFALQAFVPIWFVRHFDSSSATGDAALTMMLVAGAAGTLIGGRCADRFGRRAVLVYAMAPLVALLAVLPHLGPAAFVVALAGVGLALDGPFSTTVVMGQEMLPGRVGLASGVTLGLAIGLGGLAAAALGALADATSLDAVLAILPAFAALALVLAVSLPDRHPVQAPGAAGRRPAPATR